MGPLPSGDRGPLRTFAAASDHRSACPGLAPVRVFRGAYVLASYPSSALVDASRRHKDPTGGIVRALCLALASGSGFAPEITLSPGSNGPAPDLEIDVAS